MNYETIKKPLIRKEIHKENLKSFIDNFSSKKKAKRFFSLQETIKRFELTIEKLLSNLSKNYHNWSERIVVGKGFYLVEQ